MTVKIETKAQSGEWADLTHYMQTGGEHAPDWGPPFPDPMDAQRKMRRDRAATRARSRMMADSGPRRMQRRTEYRVRVLALAERLEITRGTGNFMVNLCRDGAARSAGRRADAKYQRPAAGPHHPNERLLTYGLRVVLAKNGEPYVTGGTARQAVCYLRAVDRWMGEDVLPSALEASA